VCDKYLNENIEPLTHLDSGNTVPPVVKAFQNPKPCRRRLVILLLLLLSFPGLANAQDTNSDVVIVGAGAAGLYAAYTLDNLGFDVIVLEARPRIGGRIHPIWQRQWDPNFWINSSDSQVITVELAAQEVESGTSNFVQDDIEAMFPGRLVPCFNSTSLYESTWDSGNATVRYPGSGSSEIYDYWDFYYHITAARHAADVSILDDLAAGGAHSAGITPSSDSFHLYAASPGSTLSGAAG
jgi:hypothetical protein